MKGKPVFVSRDTHSKIKLEAAKRGISMKEFLARTIDEATRMKEPRKITRRT